MTANKKSGLLGLRDKIEPAKASPVALIDHGAVTPLTLPAAAQAPRAPSRQGKKAITGYFSPEMSLALHHTARLNGLSLQGIMAEAFNDVLRKYGASPVGE